MSTTFGEQHQEAMIRCMLDDNHERKSLHLSRILDYLGYSKKMINYRKQAYQEHDRISNTDNDMDTVLTSGSKGEGLTKPFESDWDILYINKRIICAEEGYGYPIPRPLTVLTFSPQYEQHGYNLLALERHGTSVLEEVPGSLHLTDTGQQVFSSDKYIEYIKSGTKPQARIKYHGRSGPAISSSIGKYDFDQVHSLQSASPTILYQWLMRPRQYDWPPYDLRHQLAQMEGNFVAKGCKQSGMRQHEWRQCFNQIELILLHSLEATHRKLYVLLKIVLKDILRPLDRDKAITSYVMKNIVFWLAEMNPTESFQPKYLLKWLTRALVMLKTSLLEVSLPYYMNPSRNLLADSITEEMRKKVVRCLNRLLRAGPRLLFECKKLQFTRKMTRVELSEFCDRRDDLELTYLSCFNCHKSLQKQGATEEQIGGDETHHALITRVSELAVSDWPPHLQEKLVWCRGFERIEMILS